MRDVVISLFILPAVLAAPVPLAAQAPERATLLEPIYISADRRGEELRKQPRAVTLLDADALERTPTEPGAAIARGAPGVVFSGFGQPGVDFLNIRGVGPLGYPLSATDHTVAYSINEIPTSSFGFPPALFDMEQVEVLRGPQGTLFGRNALAGGVNFVTRGADGARERSARVELGNHGHRRADVAAGGWIAPERLAARLAFQLQDFDGDVRNSIAKGEEGGASVAAARLSLTAHPGDGWTISAMAQADRRESSNSYLMLLEHPNFPESGDNRIPKHTRDNRQLTLKIERDFNDMRFTSLSGFQRQHLTGDVGGADAYLYAKAYGGAPSNYSDPSKNYFLTDETERMLSQEFRLSSVGEQPLSWVVGFNYLHADYHGRRDAKSMFLVGSNGVTDVKIRTRAWSVFADATWSLTERLRLSGGLRHGGERQSVKGRFVSNGFPGTVPAFNQSDSIDDRYTTGRLGLSYDLTPSATGYLSVSRGYAAGGYEKLLVGSGTGTKTKPFAPATINTVEAGLKYAAPDGRLQANAAVFFNDVKNGQMFDYAFQGGGIVYTFTNQDYRSYGVEAEGRFQVTDALRLRGAATLQNSAMRNVSPTTNTGARNGAKVPLAARVTASLGFDYDLPIARLGLDGVMTLSADWAYVGAREADVGNRFRLAAYNIVDARLTYARGNLSFYAFVNNITDERPVHFGSEYGANVHAVSVGAGRVFGLGVTADF